MTWSVPRVLDDAKHELNGLLRVQLYTLVPHAIALAAGFIMARRMQPKPQNLCDELMEASTSATATLSPPTEAHAHTFSGAGWNVQRVGTYSAPGVPISAPRRNRCARASREALVFAGAATPGAFFESPLVKVERYTGIEAVCMLAAGCWLLDAARLLTSAQPHWSVRSSLRRATTSHSPPYCQWRRRVRAPTRVRHRTTKSTQARLTRCLKGCMRAGGG